MSLDEVRGTWEKLGAEDPLFAVLTDPAKVGNRWDVQEFFASGIARIESIEAELHRLGLTFSGHKALDFGCGVGRLTQALCGRFEEVVGVDISKPMLERAKELNTEGLPISYVLNTNDDLSQFRDGEFDYIQTVLVLQHMHPAFQICYLKEFARILKPGGTIYFQTPSSGDHTGAEDTLDGYVAPAAAIERQGLMRLHALPLPTVSLVLDGAEVDIVSATRLSWAGPKLTSYTYVAQKRTEPFPKIHAAYGFLEPISDVVARTVEALQISEHYRTYDYDFYFAQAFNVASDKSKILALQNQIDLIRKSRIWKLRNGIARLLGKPVR